jgi:thioesterase domain-containing protein
VDVPGNHIEMLSEPGAQIIAARIARKIEECQAWSRSRQE